jgi:MSHA biogenesis protein MshQ
MKFRMLVSLLSLFSAGALAVDPVCDTTWTKTTSSWTCNGNGKVTFSSNTSFVPSSNLTLIANNGFALSGNTVGSANIRVNFESSYGDYSISGSTVYGNLTASSGTYTISSSTVNGSITTGGNITLTSTTVTSLVTSSSNTITATNSNLQGGLTSRSGITLSGGTVNGAITMTALNIVRLTGVTMPTGSISGASHVYLDNSDLGSASANVNVTTGSNDIYVQGGSVIYGNLSAAVNSNGTVQVQNGTVYGTCLPKSNPVNACNATPPASVHHYELSYASPGVTCEGEPVTIKACTNAACTTLYSGTTSVTLAATNSGSWTNSSPTFSAGSASSALRKTTTGSSVISLSAASPTASNALVCKNSGATDSSCSISFADTGLKIFATDSVSAVPNLVSGVNYTVKLRAIQTNTTTGACQARVQGTRTVGVAFRCLNPATCVSGQRVSQGNVGIGGTAASSNPSYTNVPLTFDSNGTASVPFNYSDVGQIALHAQLSLAASGNDPAITLTAPAATPVVKPYQIRVNSVTMANATGTNPGSTSSGSGFVAAGTPFRLVLDVLNSAGNLTPNFGKESNAETLKAGFVSLVYPSAGGTGSNAYLSNVSSFTAVSGSAGRFQNVQLQWLEAGSITLQGLLSDGDYLGAGDVGLKPASSTIGRFYPQHFVLSNPSSANLCGSGSAAFSYMSQPGVPLSFTLEAVNTAGTRLLNYHSASYTGTAGIGLVAENNGSSHTASLEGRLKGQPSPTWQQGRYQFIASTLQLERGSTPDGPFLNFQPGIKVLAEQDSRNLESTVLNMNATTNGTCAGTACDAAKLGNELKFYYGRHRLENAYANAFQPAPVVLKAEVWNGSQFVLHSADSCSDVKPASLTATGTPALTVSGSNTQLSSGINPVNSLLLSAPGQNGSWSLQYQAPVWLKYNWNTNTAGDEDPSATALFGRYRGNDRLIYQREQ